jgi:hypothetical protein
MADEAIITSGRLDTPVEAFRGAGITGTPPFAQQFGPHKAPGSGGAPIKTGPRGGAKSSGVIAKFSKGGK